VLSLKAWLVGKDPLEIDKLYTQMGEGTRDLSGTRTDGSAHNLMRAVSGSRWPCGIWREKFWSTTRRCWAASSATECVYDHAAPRNMLDKASVADWRQR